MTLAYISIRHNDLLVPIAISEPVSYMQITMQIMSLIILSY